MEEAAAGREEAGREELERPAGLDEETRLPPALGACLACPAKLYRLEALAVAGLRLPASAGRGLDAGLASGRAVPEAALAAGLTPGRAGAALRPLGRAPFPGFAPLLA